MIVVVSIIVASLVFVSGHYLLWSYKKTCSLAADEPTDNFPPTALLNNNIIVLFCASLLAGITAFFIASVPQPTVEYNMLAVAAVTAVSAITDLIYKKISNYAVLSLFLFALINLIFLMVTDGDEIYPYLFSALAGILGYLLILLFVSKVTNGGIGSGDVKLMSVIAFALGFSNATYIMLFALILCLLFSIGALILGKKKIKDEVPFGPFIFGGYFIFAFLIWWGNLR